MANESICLCGGKNLRPVKAPAFDVGTLCRCGDCGMIKLRRGAVEQVPGVDPYQDSAYLAKIPQEEYYGYYKVIEEYLRQELDLSKSAAILDFGSGYSYYQKFFNEDGYREVHSLEINKHLACFARERLGLDGIFESAGELPQGHYDLVISNQVFEHLENPVVTLNHTVHPLLKPGGLVCFTVPNWDSLNRPVLRRRWLGYAPDHLWYFNKRSIETLISGSSHFDLIGVMTRSAVGKPYDGFKPKGLAKQLYYATLWRAFESMGRGDQLIVSLRANAPGGDLSFV